jgi:hypothetical protein
MKDDNSTSVQPRLWCITYEHLDGGSFNVFTVGVDMDDKTAEMLVVNNLKKTFNKDDQDNITIDNLDIGNIYFEAVPLEVDNHSVIVVPIEVVEDVEEMGLL